MKTAASAILTFRVSEALAEAVRRAARHSCTSAFLRALVAAAVVGEHGRQGGE